MEDPTEIEIYTPERIAEFHLNNAITQEDWDWAVEEIRAMGLDPANITNTDPNGRAELMTQAEFDAKFDRIEHIQHLAQHKSA